jgi:hypothetical protein
MSPEPRMFFLRAAIIKGANVADVITHHVLQYLNAAISLERLRLLLGTRHS